MLPDRWHADYALKGPGSRAMMAFAKDFVPKMADAGLLTRHWPQEYGGEESTPWEHIILSEELYSCGEPRSSAYMATNFIGPAIMRSEEHTSELQSLMRNPYAVFCLKKQKTN